MKRAILPVILMLALVGLAGLSHALAQTGGGYDLTWHRVAAGGGTSAVSDTILTGTAGQPEAGAALSGGGYTLVGGFWGGGPGQSRVYLPVVIK